MNDNATNKVTVVTSNGMEEFKMKNRISIPVFVNATNNLVSPHHEDVTVRKATELNSLDELSLASEIRRYIEKKNLPLDQLVLMAREHQVAKLLHPEIHTYMWMAKLIRALDEAGFIRSAFTLERYRKNSVIVLFYKTIRSDNTHRPFDNYVYENYVLITDEEYRAVEQALGEVLSGKQLEIARCRLGFETGIPMTLAQIAERCNVTTERARVTIANVFLALSDHRNLFPPLYGTMELSELEKLGFSRRVRWSLERNRVETANDIINLPREKWRWIRLIPGGREEVEAKMHEIGYESFRIPS